MYSDEWRAAMTADSMQAKIEEFAKIARERAEGRDESIEDVVHTMMHEEYLMKHSTGDVLSELNELQELYPDEFYRGAAAEHIISEINKLGDADVWTDYLDVSLASGLEWAVLHELAVEN